jgi:hypothetical protein
LRVCPTGALRNPDKGLAQYLRFGLHRAPGREGTD